jgi:DNA-binding transcriptional ArsR family regulator
MVNYNEKNLSQVFSVLSDPTRRAIIKELANGEKTTKKLAEPFDMSLPYFKTYEGFRTAMVSYRKVGRYKYYYLQTNSIDDAAKWIDNLKSFWESQLSSLEKYLLHSEEEKGGNEK